MAELGGLALLAATYADDLSDPESENNTQPDKEQMEVESVSAPQTEVQKSPQNTTLPNRPRLSLKLTKPPTTGFRKPFFGSREPDPPTQSFNNSQITPARKLSYGDRTRSAPAVLTNHVAPFPGLDNLGNTCYINSVLQVLYHAKEFRAHLMTAQAMHDTLFGATAGPPLIDNDHSRHVQIARDVVAQFLDLFREMDDRYSRLSSLYSEHHELDLNTAIGAAIVPRPLMRVLGMIDPQFGPGTEQQDVQEFIRVVLGHLDDADKSCSKLLSEAESNIKKRKRSHSDVMSDVDAHSENRHNSAGNGCNNHNGNNEEPPFKKARLDNGHEAMNTETNNNASSNGAHHHADRGAVTPKYLSPLKKSVQSPGPETRLSYIERLFQGSAVNSIKCLECENVSARSENFLDLSLTIQKNQNLLWSIAQFASSEQLHGDNKYSCENCRTHTEAVKSTKFGALPRILTIHFKRFRHEMYSTEKINHHIPSPLYLRLDKWCEKTCKEKNSIYGTSMSYGHYYSYLKIKRPTTGNEYYGTESNNINGSYSHHSVHNGYSNGYSNGSTNGSTNGSDKEEHSWIYCDDESVTFKTEKEILNLFNVESKSSSTAYILFYRSLDDHDLRGIDSNYLYKHLNQV